MKDTKRVIFIVLLTPVWLPLMLLAFIGNVADIGIDGMAKWLNKVV